MLMRILNYIKQQKVTSDQQISREFSIEISALEPMLNCWVRKGLIKECATPSCRTQCFKCKKVPVYYTPSIA